MITISFQCTHGSGDMDPKIGCNRQIIIAGSRNLEYTCLNVIFSWPLTGCFLCFIAGSATVDVGKFMQI